MTGEALCIQTCKISRLLTTTLRTKNGLQFVSNVGAERESSISGRKESCHENSGILDMYAMHMVAVCACQCVHVYQPCSSYQPCHIVIYHIQHCTMPCHAIPYHTIPYHTKALARGRAGRGLWQRAQQGNKTTTILYCSQTEIAY